MMVGGKHKQFFEDLLFLVESGEIPLPRIDDAVERILRVKFVTGLFEYPFADRSLLDVVGCKVSFQYLLPPQYILSHSHTPVVLSVSLENRRFCLFSPNGLV